jgi:ABC-type transport system involved in cytochrome c biogenesis permease component
VLSFPLITRELRVQSRRRATYNARILWGLAAVGVLLFFTLSFPEQSVHGHAVLSATHFCLAVMIFVLAPVGAADAISREKREGTLGLLLLTRLTPRQVVLGKLAAHFIRLFYIAFMMLPFMMIPVLLGGVSLHDFLLSAATLLTLAAAGLGAGLIASALLLNFGAALCWALLLSAAAGLLIGSSVANAALILFPTGIQAYFDKVIRIFMFGPALLIFPLVCSEGVGLGTRGIFWFINAGLVVLSALFLRWAVIFSGWRVARHAESAGETKRQAAFRRTFLTPVLWKNTFRRFMRRSLDRNPLVWLEYRTAWARSARWAMILIVILLETALIFGLPDRAEFLTAHFFMLLTLVTFLTFKSSSSFQREKESGAFELILVTPFTEAKLWSGRLRAVASYYALPVFLLLGLGLYGFHWAQTSYYINYHEPNQLPTAVNFTTICASLVSVPVAGLFFALRCRSFIPALLWTGGLAVFAPFCLWAAFHGLLWMAASTFQAELAMVFYEFLRAHWWPALLPIVGYHAILIGLAGRATLRLLRERQFVGS